MYAVIMAGGQGTRLWPKSRRKQPKQLQSLVSEESLVQQTYFNLSQAIKPENFIVSTTPQYLDEIRKHLPKIPKNNFIVEPYPMGTAAACGLVSKILNLRDSNSTAAFFPSDHNINNPNQFAKILKYVEIVSEKHPDQILTIGIQPTKPDTGMGYIQFSTEIERRGQLAAFKVKRFVEKPDAPTAEKYLATGEYLWNAGMFIWKTSLVLDLIKKDLPKTSKVLDKIASEYGKPGYDKALDKYFKDADDTSVDYGIMEKNKNILVVPGDFGWSDIGSWGTLLDVVCEISGSKVVSRGNHIGVDNSNVLVMGHDKLIATVGLENIIIVDTPDAILICNSKKDQKIKEIINYLKDKNKVEYL